MESESLENLLKFSGVGAEDASPPRSVHSITPSTKLTNAWQGPNDPNTHNWQNPSNNE